MLSSDADHIYVADVVNCVNDATDIDDGADDGFLCGACEEGYQNPLTDMSVEGSLLFADDDRRELPALYHQDLQGGNSKSKHFVVEDGIVCEDCTDFPTFLPELSTGHASTLPSSGVCP